MARLHIANPASVIILSHQTRSLKTDHLFFSSLEEELVLQSMECAPQTSDDEVASTTTTSHADVDATATSDRAIAVKLPRAMLPAQFGQDIEVLNVFAIGKPSVLAKFHLAAGAPAPNE